MTDKEIAIQQAVLKLRENITAQILIIESLSALLPRQKKEKPRGYYIDPETNQKRWYDKAAKRRHERDKLKLVIKEAS